ncbi:MAG TPA: PIN domain-containing protein [Nitrosospira sp.]|nr:PIN domain-containing protein [Nitrosospira sp.]
MKEGRAFIDTNVLLYLLSGNELKAGRAEELVATKGIISVQVLNEFASVATRKLKMSWPEIQEILSQVRKICPVQPVSVEVHDCGLKVAERYGYAVYDAMIIASALLAGCTALYSEDMQDGQVIDGKLSILNPFV